mmetsp:Transcript_103924/g.155632  ORF Transcript_103924/g.155632 Transcript_103924/m.155632 type:complete len:101 (+) Transcript_103924:593-895(+)
MFAWRERRKNCTRLPSSPNFLPNVFFNLDPIFATRLRSQAPVRLRRGDFLLEEEEEVVVGAASSFVDDNDAVDEAKTCSCWCGRLLSDDATSTKSASVTV